VRNRELERPSAGFGLARALGLVLNYFVGHTFVYPILLSILLTNIAPQAIVYPLWSLILWYGTTLLVSIVLAWPLLVESLRRMRHDVRHTVRIALTMFPLMYFTSIFVSILITWLSGQATSGNQTSLNELLGQFPVFTLALTIIFAPIVEELVFRGAFYRFFRAKGMYWFPMFLSATAFSLIHLMVALSTGSWGDLWYFPLYALLGIFLAVAYEKTGNIFGPILLHFTYNAVGMLIALIAR
jgi:membrane protease YdiL (CAAX protease family)